MSSQPDFLIIGSPKAGTSYLFDLLGQHPDVFLTDPKEPCFFSLPDRYALGWQWYSELFADAASSQVTGEASTHYADGRHIAVAIPRIKAHIPQVKLIYLVRNPVIRLFSHYRFYLQEIDWVYQRYIKQDRPFPDDYRYYFDEVIFRFESHKDAGAPITPTFEEFQKMFAGAFVETSRYFSNIEFILSQFPSSQLKVLVAEDLFNTPQATLDDVFDFLGLKPRKLQTNKIVNDFGGTVEKAAQVQLREKFTSLPLTSYLSAYSPQFAKKAFWYLWKKAGGGGPRQITSVARLDRTQHERLLAEFRDDITKLSRFLGRDLTEIWR